MTDVLQRLWQQRHQFIIERSSDLQSEYEPNCFFERHRGHLTATDVFDL
jgi:hypothetical protein